MWAFNELKKRVSILGDNNESKEKEKPNPQQQQQQPDESQNDIKISDEKQSDSIPYVNSSEWYESNSYKELFKPKIEKSKKWITESITNYLDSNYNEYNDNNLISLINKQPDNHKYSNIIQEALNIFNEWRGWKNINKTTGSNQNEWKLSSSEKYKLDSYNDTHLNCYWNNINNSNISVTKGEMILPYSTPIICGIIENPKHECAYEEYSDQVYDIKYLSQYSSLCYAKTKTPMFIAERDIFGIAFNYVLPNAEVIMGCRSIEDSSEYEDIISKYRGSKEYVRAFYTLDLYHLRPWYERNSNYTVITYYSHLDLRGTIPNWLINSMISDTPKIIISLKKYIDSNIKLLSKQGELHIPVKMLQYIGIYTDINNNNNNNKLEYGYEFEYDDEQLSDAEMKHDKNEEILTFVNIGTKSQSNQYKQREKGSEYDDIPTPIPTPDLQNAAISNENDIGSSDLGAENDESDNQMEEFELDNRNKRRTSGVYDIDNMVFAFEDNDLSDGNINAKNQYKQDMFVNVNEIIDDVVNNENDDVKGNENDIVDNKGNDNVDVVSGNNDEIKQNVNDNNVENVMGDGVKNVEDDMKQRRGDRDSYDENVDDGQGNDEEKSNDTGLI